MRKRNSISWKAVAALVGGFVGLQLVYGIILFRSLGWAERAQFGDAFGAIGALFSGLALAGVVVTVWQQRQELALQQEELELTRDELRRSADAQSEVARLAREQLRIASETQVADFVRQKAESAPSFELSEFDRVGPLLRWAVRNVGAPVNIQSFDCTQSGIQITFPKANFDSTTSPSLMIHNPEDHDPIQFAIRFLDRPGRHRSYLVEVDAQTGTWTFETDFDPPPDPVPIDPRALAKQPREEPAQGS